MRINEDGSFQEIPMTPQNAPKTDEPEVAQEEDVAVDRKNSEGEQMIKQVHNDRLSKKAPTPPKPSSI
jgi:hypothetical protein